MAVKAALETAGIEVRGAELTMQPITPVAVSPEDAKKVIRLTDALEELDDIQNVYHNMELTDEVLAALDS